jgi:tRNA-guanine family transglycosylase
VPLTRPSAVTFEKTAIALKPPIIWLGQSVRTTLVLPSHPAIAGAPIMASLGDAVHRPRLLKTVFSGRLRERLKARGPVLLDSGGFTAMVQRGTNPRVEEIAQTYAVADADILVSLDAPPTLQCGANERRRKYSVTLANLQTLVSALGRDRIAPVIHGRSVPEILRNARAAREICSSPLMVCIGGLVPLLRRTGGSNTIPSDNMCFIAEAIAAVRSTFGCALLHVLGAGAPRTVVAALALGADSVDSIGWRRAAGFGTVFIPGRGERFVEARSRHRASSRPFLSMEEIITCQCPICAGLTPQDRLIALAANYRARAAHNAWILLEEAAAFSAARESQRLVDYLETRLPPSWIAAWQRVGLGGVWSEPDDADRDRPRLRSGPKPG